MNIRTTTKHENDIPPVLVWFVTSFAAGAIAAYVAGGVLRALGHTHQITATVVGGGETTVVASAASEWYGGMIGVFLFLTTFTAWYVRDWWVKKNE